jgi:hypothetical protein
MNEYTIGNILIKNDGVVYLEKTEIKGGKNNPLLYSYFVPIGESSSIDAKDLPDSAIYRINPFSDYQDKHDKNKWICSHCGQPNWESDIICQFCGAH